MIAIVLASGGMDSCVSAAIAAAENDAIALLHISYGQRTEARERKAFNDIADFYGVKDRMDVSIEYLAKIGGSSLTDVSMSVTEADLGERVLEGPAGRGRACCCGPTPGPRRRGCPRGPRGRASRARR